VVAVADHQPVTGLVDLTCVGVDVGGDFGLQRRREHRPGAVADQLVQQRPAHPSRGVSVGPGLFLDYIEHGRTFPNQRVNAGPDQSFSDFQIILGKVRTFTSPGRGPSTCSDHCSFMAPEEFKLGAQLDERTTVFTLGRIVWHFATRLTENRAEFCGSKRLAEELERACQPSPTDRHASVADFANS